MKANPLCPSELRDSSEQVLEMLRDQQRLFAKLESVAEHQRTLITRHDAVSLLSVLADRQRISAKLGELSKRFEPVRARWGAHRDRFDHAQRDEARQLLADIKGRIGRVMEADEQDVKLLSVQKQVAATAIRSAHLRSAAMAVYRAPAASVGARSRVDEEAQ